METEDRVDNWFQTTFERTRECVKPSSEEIDRLILGVLLSAREYTQAVLCLLDRKHGLPAAALLRVLCELYVKIFWCLNAEGDREQVLDAIHLNFQRWDYTRLINDIKLLEQRLKYITGELKAEVDRELRKARRGKKTYDTRQIKKMKDVASLCLELSQDGDTEAMPIVYTQVYRKYSRAVHLDKSTFSRIAKHEDDTIICHDDWDDAVEDLYKNCWCMACDINMLIRHHYGIEEPLRQEYDKLTSEYNEHKEHRDLEKKGL